MTGAADPRPSLLVVASDTPRRAALAELLRGAFPGALVATAAADEAAALASGDVDVLVCADGLAAARRLRRHPGSDHAHVIALADGVAAGAAAEAGDDFVLEPLREPELVARVAAGLRRIGEVRRLHRRARDLELLYARQSDFLSLVSHEIRTPLSAILSSANILMRYGGQRPDSVERFARVIHQEGQRLTRLINNLLDLAKIEAGQVEWRAETVAVADLFERVRESFSALTGERQVRLEVDGGGAGELRADADKLTQVLLNLLSNAVKHSPDGTTVRLRARRGEGETVRLEVEDEGAGIPPGMEERVFERFAQLEAGDERGGSGLGLTICREIVEHHGGRVWAVPGRAAGALFIVELPRQAAFEAGDGPA